MGVKRCFDNLFRLADRSLSAAVYGFRASKAQPASCDTAVSAFADHIGSADDHFEGSHQLADPCNMRSVLCRPCSLHENYARQYQKRTEKDVPYHLTLLTNFLKVFSVK